MCPVLKLYLVPLVKMILLLLENQETEARSEVLVGGKHLKMEKTLSKSLALQPNIQEGTESILMRQVAVQGVLHTIQALPEETERAAEGASSMVEAEATEAVTQEVHVVGQGVGAAETIEPLPAVVISMAPLAKIIRGRGHLVDMAKEALSPTLGVPETIAKPEARARSMKKCRKGGGKGVLKQAVRVLLVTLHTLTKRIASQLPKKEQVGRI